MYMKVSGETRICMGPNKNPVVRANDDSQKQGKRLHRSLSASLSGRRIRSLEGEPRALELQARGFLTSRLATVFEFELDGSGQPTQGQSARAGYRLRSLWALRNNTQNTTVMRTSPAAVRGVNQGSGIDLSER